MGKPAPAAICVLLAAIVLACFCGTVRNGFTGYDDGEYVTENPHVKTGLTWENFRWAWAGAASSNWYPLTWLSHALDCELFGLAPAGHHLTSLVLHALNTVLLFLWLHGLTAARWRSAFVALTWGLHPLHVESVAWVSERKDVLSTFFWMLALLAYTAYARKPRAARYMLVTALFTAGLLSKPMVVTLPAVLLLLDRWPLKRTAQVTMRRLVLEKVPLLGLAAAATAATIWAHRQTGSVVTMEAFPLSLRLANGAVSYLRYLWKTVWPVDLAVFYPMPASGIPPLAIAASLVALAGISYLAYAAKIRRPWLTFGWCWYIVTVLPVIGIVQTGMQAMADRYMYLPMIGLLVAVAWQAEETLQSRPALCMAATAAIAACAILSWRQIPVWKDGITLFTHAIEVTHDNFLAHDNLGVELDRRGRPEEALRHYRETLRIKPGDRHGEENYAMSTFAKAQRIFEQGKLEESLALFHDGLQHRPNNAAAHLYAGLILVQQNRIGEAHTEFLRAIAIDSSIARAHIGLGVVLAQGGDLTGSTRELEEALKLEPENHEARSDLDLVKREGRREK